MSVMNSITTMGVGAMVTSPPATEAPVPGRTQIDAFNKFLFAGTPQGDVGTLTPSQMLVQQATTLGATVGVDLGAKVAGAVSQSVNKLTNMT